MKFLTFNIVVLGALYFLYQFGGGSAATPPEPANEPTRQVESHSQEREVVHALSDRVAVLAQNVARLEGHVSEVLQRGEAGGAAAAAEAQANPTIEATPKAPSKSPAKSTGAAPRAPRPKAPTRPASAPSQDAASYASAAQATAARDTAAQATAAESDARERESVKPDRTGGSEFSTAGNVAAREIGSEWSDGRATGDPVAPVAGVDDSQSAAAATPDAPLIEGELMTPSQRRNALLRLAQDMELHYLASAGE